MKEGRRGRILNLWVSLKSRVHIPEETPVSSRCLHLDTTEGVPVGRLRGRLCGVCACSRWPPGVQVSSAPPQDYPTSEEKLMAGSSHHVHKFIFFTFKRRKKNLYLEAGGIGCYIYINIYWYLLIIIRNDSVGLIKSTWCRLKFSCCHFSIAYFLGRTCFWMMTSLFLSSHLGREKINFYVYQSFCVISSSICCFDVYTK